MPDLQSATTLAVEQAVLHELLHRFWARPPYYAECRFTAQSAPGTWAAFWTLTEPRPDLRRPGQTKDPVDELDVVEAYGGAGRKNPNHPGYTCFTHFWRQFDESGRPRKGIKRLVPIMELGGRSYWSTTFHTYGVKVTETDTIYYFDDIEVMRHPTGERSLDRHFFLINYAIGGTSGWQIDLERYGNGSDMYVDYIRVYEGR